MNDIDCEKIDALTAKLEQGIVYRLAVDDPRPMNAAQYDLARELGRSGLGDEIVVNALADFPDINAIQAYSRLCVSARTLTASYRQWHSISAA